VGLVGRQDPSRAADFGRQLLQNLSVRGALSGSWQQQQQQQQQQRSASSTVLFYFLQDIQSDRRRLVGVSFLFGGGFTLVYLSDSVAI